MQKRIQMYSIQACANKSKAGRGDVRIRLLSIATSNDGRLSSEPHETLQKSAGTFTNSKLF